ncbi:MAG: Na+/H+ antiporter NhaC, partial [Maribacter sp.]
MALRLEILLRLFPIPPLPAPLSQDAEIGATTKRKLKYMLPAAFLALVAYFIVAYGSGSEEGISKASSLGNPKGLPMLLVPAFVIYLFLKGKHLLHGLLFGLLFGTFLGLILGLLTISEVLSLDLENFTAKSFIIDGINRAVGLRILLMGLVATLKTSGLMDKLVDFAATRANTQKHAKGWVAGIMSMAVLLTTPSIVPILLVTDFTKKPGEQLGVS